MTVELELELEAKTRAAELKATTELLKPSNNGNKSTLAKEIDKTQLGIADRFAKAYQDDFKYVEGMGWYSWTGKHWKQDESYALRAMRKIIEQILELAKNLEKQAIDIKYTNDESQQPKVKALEKEAKEYKALAQRHMTANGLSEALKAARINQNMRSEFSVFDTHKMLLNCSNGTLNLQSGDLMPHQKSDLLTKMINVEYNPDATCPTWLKFIDDIMLSDNELTEYLQRIIGICLTGSTHEHGFFVLHGNGSNGKSTFITTIQKLLGCYAQEVKTELLLRGGISNAHGPTEELAKLVGARLATANETDQGKKLSESIVKAMTGGDKITARRLHQKPFEFIPEFKLFLRTNHKPDVDGTDEGIWRRIKLIPFDAEFKAGKADIRLPEKLEAELPGILTWAIKGLHKYLAIDGTGGLIEPPKVKEAIEQYRDDQNVFSAFLRQDLVPKMPPTIKGYTVSYIQDKFNAWAQKESHETLLSTEVSKELKKLGWTEQRPGKDGKRLKVPPAHWRTTSAENENLSATQNQ